MFLTDVEPPGTSNNRDVCVVAQVNAALLLKNLPPHLRNLMVTRTQVRSTPAAAARAAAITRQAPSAAATMPVAPNSALQVRPRAQIHDLCLPSKVLGTS